jgi:hypothetical protein
MCDNPSHKSLEIFTQNLRNFFSHIVYLAFSNYKDAKSKIIYQKFKYRTHQIHNAPLNFNYSQF